ncbi:MAG: L,D-transpeptidase [Desulfobacterales bacterium]|nr:L,D-transpeptidase [Pseudomonadota bacterium]MBU4353808.1 L,D-transpeptidase [Pseudomonadota bacterium]MCG2772113.1 L,D-transpeptidase [Desulfobacterales bacterium]
MNKVKIFYCFIIVIFVQISVVSTGAFDVFQEYEKIIWIDQPKQIGIAYERGKKLFEFPVVTGDDETTTNPGIYRVKLKNDNYYSRKYDTPMPYSMFFDLREMKAIHEGEVPPPEIKKELATHGCIHVEPPYIQKLYDWADEENTAVVISGWRTGD